MSTYRELATQEIRKVISLIDKACSESEITFFLIGAQAKDIQFLEKGMSPLRATLDVDFAVMVKDIESFDRLKEKLKQNGFKEDKIPHRMIYMESDTIIDLLPYGKIEEERTVNFNQREVELSVIGIREVGEKAVNVDLDGISIKVSPLEGLFILKLIAFTEKPGRVKDLDDIKEIIDNYFEINQDNIYKNEKFLLEDIPNENFRQLAGAVSLGFNSGKIIKQSPQVRRIIFDIINKELDNSIGSIAQYYLQKDMIENQNQAQEIFKHIKSGLTTDVYIETRTVVPPIQKNINEDDLLKRAFSLTRENEIKSCLFVGENQCVRGMQIVYLAYLTSDKHNWTGIAFEQSKPIEPESGIELIEGNSEIMQIALDQLKRLS